MARLVPQIRPAYVCAVFCRFQLQKLTYTQENLGGVEAQRTPCLGSRPP